jgi:hypothetical protein
MGNRYNELLAKGKSGKAAAEIINQEFRKNLTFSTIRGYGHQAKKQTVPSESKEHNEHSVDQLPPEHIADELEARMRAIAKEVFQEMMTTMPTATSPVYEADMPPEPGPGGRHGKKDREYFKISLTIDQGLWNRFIEERDALRLSSGRLMDKILWEYYGRPSLSYGSKNHQD